MNEFAGANPRADASASGERTDSAILTTAARALATGAALTKPQALRGIGKDLQAIGIQEAPKHWGTWPQRRAIVEVSDRVLRRFGVEQRVTETERSREGRWHGSDRTIEEPDRRVDLWSEVSRTKEPAVAVAWLRLLATDSEPVTAAAASAALSGWQRPKNEQVPEPLEYAATELERHAASPFDLAREIGHAALGDDVAEDHGPERGDPPEAESTSLLIHGTWAYKGDWWYPGGDFHTFVKDKIRADVYDKKNCFQWSGAYRGRHRKVATERLAGWVEDTVGGPLNAVMAHSYGGIVALGATALGVKIETLVLLSVPVENPPTEWRNVGRAVSLRIHLDLALLAARRRQYFTENVEESYLPYWFTRHGASHDPAVWEFHKSQLALGL